VDNGLFLLSRSSVTIASVRSPFIERRISTGKEGGGNQGTMIAWLPGSSILSGGSTVSLECSFRIELSFQQHQQHLLEAPILVVRSFKKRE